MKLSALKTFLMNSASLQIELPQGGYIPAHFHITEIGLISKHFIDCGGVVRHEKFVNLQIWTSHDLDHRLLPQKLLKIISLYEEIIGDEDLEIEAEYQGETIGKYGLELRGDHLKLTRTQTNCLASDHCGITPESTLSETTASVVEKASCCTPGGGCC